jgi:hypothetical protein
LGALGGANIDAFDIGGVPNLADGGIARYARASLLGKTLGMICDGAASNELPSE